MAETDTDTFEFILEDNLGLGDMHKLDRFYIERLLQGEDIVNEVMEYNDENFDFTEVLKRLVFYTSGMNTGDTPNLMLMLIVKKALLEYYLAEKNIKTLKEGKKEIYDISILL